MRLLNIGALAALALMTAGCSGCSITAPNATTGLSRTVVDDKAVLAVELAWGVALDTATQGAQDGRIKGKAAADVADLIRRGIPIRQALETAHRGSNATDVFVQIQALREVAGQLSAIAAANGVTPQGS